MSPADDRRRPPRREPGGGHGDARRDDGRRDDTRRDAPRRDDARRDAAGRQRGAARAEGRGHRSAAAPGERRRTTDPARDAAFDVLRAVDGSDSYANLVLPPLLAERGLHGRDAAFATELAYGTLRLRGRYDAVLALASGRDPGALDAPLLDVLRLGAHQVLGMRVPPHAAVSETVGLARARVGAGPAQLVNAVLRRVTEAGPEEWTTRVAQAADPTGDDTVARLAVTESHPAWVVRALREALVGHGRRAEELPDLLAADNVAPRVTLVARPGLVARQELLDELPHARAAALTPSAVVLDGGDPADVRAVADGRAGVQDEGSQLVALALLAAGVEGTDARWLDLCAGPGGKAALLAAAAAGRGARLVATEVQPHRTRLVERALRAVPRRAVEAVRTGDGRAVGADEPGAFDRVLVDAPCTGLGALRRRPESRWRRTPADVAGLGTLQRELLSSALDAVRPGGVVAYVTCSPHLAETSLVVRDVVRARARAGVVVTPLDARAVVRGLAPDVDLGDDRTPGGEPRLDVQLWPHVHGTDAMYLALLRRD
ncbi:RsmB/NOP family class I SAM-dependent RNA methyltransferase [Cellulomonas marina]|uniref:16S rRNA (Cytosine967-C5)-methyltransferase n=1 Tax=Cellulomonas marina TaxID=988821 RepID=A0A1I0WA14_9CELL|nr:transcription antitermination factor NusB [Cellulomonas marina]GIG29100.1 rRNA cytosine-C5-methyltransferase [Cellulomonas marina]SFA85060.1 16S rRNA (cytosine967-C5)-methyltransferase [Cellulomonas marina]